MGSCSLCGEARTSASRAWGIRVTWLDRPLNDDDNPFDYIACRRCRQALREIAEICFGDAMSGVIEVEADAPYYQGDPRLAG